VKKEEGALRLDKLLRFWEDTCFIHAINSKVRLMTGKEIDFPLAGPLLHAHEFRRYVLEYKGKNFDFLRFCGIYQNLEKFGAIMSVPMSILGWNHHSRRIFHLPSDMQTILDATSLGGIKWEEIKFPFDSFLVTLEDPLISDNGQEYDCILLSSIDEFIPGSKEKEGPIIEMRLLPKSLDDYEGISKSEKKRVESFVSNGQLQEVLSFIMARPKSKKFPLLSVHLFPEMLNEKTVKDLIPKMGEYTGQIDMTKDQAIDSALHIIVNLCLYLENFPSGSAVKEKREQPQPRKKFKSFDFNAITEKSEIFTIKCKFNMNQSEIDKLVKEIKEEKAGREKCTYWRRAHWRRKPYCGHIPMKIAPKDWIPRKLINADRLPPNSLPKGSEATMFPDS